MVTILGQAPSCQTAEGNRSHRILASRSGCVFLDPTRSVGRQIIGTTCRSGKTNVQRPYFFRDRAPAKTTGTARLSRPSTTAGRLGLLVDSTTARLQERQGVLSCRQWKRDRATDPLRFEHSRRHLDHLPGFIHVAQRIPLLGDRLQQVDDC